MASVLVVIGDGRDRPAPEARHVLAEGRRIATRAGATLHAVALVPSSAKVDPWVESLGRAGADKVVLAQDPSFANPPTWSTHGDTLLAICLDIRPLLILFFAGAMGQELAPRLAAALGSPFFANAYIELGDAGDLGLARALSGGDTWRLAVDSLGRPVVATLHVSAHTPVTTLGDDDANLVLFPVDVSTASQLTLVASEPAPNASLERANVVVSAGAGVATAENFALCEQLAEVLGGVVATTLPAHRRGLGRADQVVDISRAHVSPRQYIACGSSGSTSHLAGVSPDATIVAINTDPAAPIFQVASHGIVGDVGDVLPDLIELATGAV